METKQNKVTVIKSARLIDGTGAAPVERATVIIQDKRIVAVGPDGNVAPPDAAPEDIQTFDASGLTLLPGFIDCHVHIWVDPDPLAPPKKYTNIPIRDAAYHSSRDLLYAVNAARSTLEAGFTTIRDLMAPNDL